VLLATAGRPIRFLMAAEIYSQPHIRWAVQMFRCIPVQRGRRDIRAIRTMLEGLAAKEIVGLFPEGGLDRHRWDEGHPAYWVSGDQVGCTSHPGVYCLGRSSFGDVDAQNSFCAIQGYHSVREAPAISSRIQAE